MAVTPQAESSQPINGKIRLYVILYNCKFRISMEKYT